MFCSQWLVLNALLLGCTREAEDEEYLAKKQDNNNFHLLFSNALVKPTAFIQVEQEMQFWYVTLYNNKLQFLYLTCLHDSRQLFPLQLRGWFQCCLFWATVKRSQYSIFILSFLTVTTSLKAAFSFQNGFSPIFTLSPFHHSHAQTFPSPLHTYSTPFCSPLKINFTSHLSSIIATEHSKAVHSNHLAENSWVYLQQNYEKSQDFPNYHFSLKDTPLSPSCKHNHIFMICAKRTEDRYLVVLFAFEMSSFLLYTMLCSRVRVYTQSHEFRMPPQIQQLY